MASEISIQTILNIGDLSSVLASVANQKNTLFKGATLDPMLPRTIARVKRSIALRFSANPSDSTLRGTAEYLLQLCGPFALQSKTILNNLSGSLPVITGPSNQSGLSGFTATFSVSVAGTGPFTYQWFRNSVLVPGATSASLSVPNAQLSDTGATFFVQVTNAAGTQTSGTATLTVTASITGFFTFSPAVDFYPILLTNSDPFSYGTSYTITHNAPIVITLPGAMPANQFMLAKVPIGESVKTIWNNTVINNGTIPDIAFESIVQFGGFTYYASRNQISMDITQPLTLS